MHKKWSEWIELRDRLSAISGEFLEVIINVDPKLSEKKGICGSWSAKDIVAHIVAWEKEVIERFRLFMEGITSDNDYDIDTFNQKSVTDRKEFSWGEIYNELKLAQDELKQVNESIIQENINTDKRFIEWIGILIDHYKHHMSQIKDLI